MMLLSCEITKKFEIFPHFKAAIVVIQGVSKNVLNQKFASKLDILQYFG